MKQNKNLLYIFSILFLFSFQTNEFKKIWELKIKGSLVSVDKLGKVYLAESKKISKYNNKGQILQQYSNLNLGNITSIDTKNSLQTLLFFKDQQEIILLDNMLGESNTINLTNYFEWVDLICFSNRDNAFWLYSANNQQLIKTNKNLDVTSQTNNLSQALSIDLHPSQLIETNENIYLIDTTKGIFVFDLFGNYKKKIVIKGINKVSVLNDIIYYSSKNNIYYYNTKSFDKGLLYKSTKSIVDFSISKNMLYIKSNSMLTSFKV